MFMVVNAMSTALRDWLGKKKAMMAIESSPPTQIVVQITSQIIDILIVHVL